MPVIIRKEKTVHFPVVYDFGDILQGTMIRRAENFALPKVGSPTKPARLEIPLYICLQNACSCTPLYPPFSFSHRKQNVNVHSSILDIISCCHGEIVSIGRDTCGKRLGESFGTRTSNPF